MIVMPQNLLKGERMTLAENKSNLPGIGIFVIAGIVFLILAVLASVLVMMLVTGNNNDEVPEEENGIIEYTGITFPLGEFTTNLADEGGRRIFQVEITIELSESDVKDELEAREPQIKDRIYTIIRSKSSEDLKKEDGMQDLRQQIKDAINDHIREGEVVNVYFNRPLIT